jgi:ADP-ribosylglycohydrolase
MDIKYNAVFLVHSLGDIIGLNFAIAKDSEYNTINEYIYEFINLGGINGLDISKLYCSTNTLYHIAIADAMLQYKKIKKKSKFLLNVDNNLQHMTFRILHDKEKKSIDRYKNEMTIDLHYKLHHKQQYKYGEGGGNGAAVRSVCIGLMDVSIEELVRLAISISEITHKSPLGYLASLTIAYFIRLAINNTAIEKWPKLLMELLESKNVITHIDLKNKDINSEYHAYIGYWQHYMNTRFNNAGDVITTRAHKNLIFRFKYYYENFVKNSYTDDTGSSGICAVIMAYDCVLDAGNSWEKLVFYSMIHFGDSRGVGSLAGALYGALYGYGDIPEHMLKNIDERKTLLKYSRKFYKMFHT